MKTKIILILLGCFSLAFDLSVQSVDLVSGSFCVNGGATWVISGVSGCSSFTWGVTGGGTKGVDYNWTTNTQQGFNVTFLTPRSGAAVFCSYSCSSPGGGTMY